MGSARGQSASTGSGPTATVGPIRPPSPMDPSVPAVNIRIRARLPQDRRGPIIPCG